MSAKDFKKAITDLLALSPAAREARKPSDGFEELAKTIIEKAITDKDGAMLKYVSDLVEKGGQGAPKGPETIRSKLDILAATAEEGIDE